MVLLRTVTLLCLAAPVAEAQSAFVHVLRGDTIVIERFTRTPTRLDVSMTMKGGARQVTSSRIAGNGHLGAMTLAAYASGAADALPAVEAQVELTGDTAIASMRSGGAPARIQRIPTRAAAQPMLSNSFAQFEALVMAARVGVDAEITRTPWLTFFAAHDPIATAHKVAVPVLMVQGGDDQQVIAAETPLLEKAFRDGGNRDVTARVFPALNHFFILQPGGDPAGYSTLATNLASAEVLGVVADWIAMRASHVPSP